MTVDQEIVLGCAFRYALGRSTYVVGSVCSELVLHEKELDWPFKERIAKEIQEHQDEFGKAGMDMDDQEWDYVKKLFSQDRRVLLEANLYKTDEWVEVEAVDGSDGKYYSLEGRNKWYHTVRNVRLKPY